MLTDLPPAHLLRAFDAAGRHGSFKLAASLLHVTPSAISHQMADLERYLGVKLFTRSAGRIALTPSGQKLLMEVAAAFEQLRAACARLRVAGQPSSIRISANPFFADEVLTPQLRAFGERFPDLSVHLEATEALHDPRDGSVDFCVRFAGAVEPGLTREALYPVEAIIVAAPDAAVDTLIDYPFHGISAWAQWRQRGGKHPQANRHLSFSSYSAALRAAAAGLGLCIAMQPMPWLADGRVRRISNDAVAIGDLYLSHRPLAPSQRVLRAVRDWWVEAIRHPAS